MHTHYHTHCKHDLSYCDHCDVCFCTKCGREWGQKFTYTYTVDPYVWTYRGVPYTVKYESGDYTLTTANGTAVKDSGTLTAFYSSTNNNPSNNTTHTHSTKS